MAHASDRIPGADIVPLETGRHHGNPLAFLEHTFIHGKGRHPLEELIRFPLIEQRQQITHLRRRLLQLLEKECCGPHEDAGVPEVALAHVVAGGLTRRLLDELAHLVRFLVTGDALARAHVPVARFRPSGRHPDRNEPLLSARQFCALLQLRTEDIAGPDHVVGVQ
jgi:hypothetical protein